MLSESWRPVRGYEGEYEVSDMGRVKSLKGGSGRILKPGRSAGYPFINLLLNGHQRSSKIHRLVAEAFIPNPESLDTVNHIDGDKANNHVDNLEWASYSDNNTHALYAGLKNQIKAVVAIPTRSLVGYWFPSQSRAVMQGFDQSGISGVCRGVKTTHHGYKWAFCDADIAMDSRRQERFAHG